MSIAREFYERLLATASGETDPKLGLVLLRQLMESIYKDICASKGKTSFTGLHARMQYVHEALDCPPDLVTQTNDLRILANRAAHEEVSEDLNPGFASGVFVLSRFIAFAYQEPVPPELSDWLNAKEARPFPRREHAKKLNFMAVVDSWSLVRGVEGVNGICLNVNDEEGMSRSVMLYDDLRVGNGGRCWSLLSRCLWKHATIYCQNLSQASNSDASFISNPSTIIVLEPDFLIDASSLSECFTTDQASPEYYILTRLFAEPSSDKMVMGQTINNIFDEAITNPDKDYLTLFRESLASGPINMISLGKPLATEIHRTIEKDHYPHIKSFISELGDSQIQLEPSYICPEYGLQGRLDLLYRRGEKYHIVELKSGKPPAMNTWKAQEMQVIAYNMIIRNCYGHNNLGGSAIFYSASPDKPLRFVENFIAKEQDLLMCRNRIVGILHQLTIDPAKFFDWLKLNPSPGKNPIQKSKQERFTAFTAQLAEHEYEWFLEQTRRIILELWYVKTGSGSIRDDNVHGHNALWQESREQKKREYRIISDLRMEKCLNNVLYLSLSSDEEVHNFRQGDIIILYKQSIPIGKQQIFRGTIQELEGNRLVLKVRGGIKNNPGLAGAGLWCIEHDVLETMLYTPLASITTFLSSDREKRAMFLGIDRPGFDKQFSTQDHDLGTILSRAKSAKDYFVIQGPPGTGKTSGLLKSYIAELFRQTDRKLLVVSFTNRAVDEICSHLTNAGIPYLRTGSSQSIEQELLNKAIQGKNYDEISEIICKNRIWLSTVQSCNSWITDLTRIIHFDELIVDEASQIVEPSILGIISKAGKTILTGDQNQLPPITAQSAALYSFSSPILRKLQYTTYNQSLMERLYRLCTANNWDQAVCMLSTHYRMHDAIAGLINHYYQNRLVSNTDRQRHSIAQQGKLLPDHRLIWVDTPITPKNHYDPDHADAIVAILKSLEQSGMLNDPEKDFGIIAPYRSMIHCLRQKLPERFSKVTIDTVERFQGSERNIMLLTLPLKDSGDLKTLESISADGAIDRKLNVAVSRAREQLIILGNKDLCSYSPHYRNIIDKISKTGICIPLARFVTELAQ